VQIRTKEMDMLAEAGVAAHWAYEEGVNNDARDRTSPWLNMIADMQQSTANTEEFVENVKMPRQLTSPMQCIRKWVTPALLPRSIDACLP